MRPSSGSETKKTKRSNIQRDAKYIYNVYTEYFRILIIVISYGETVVKLTLTHLNFYKRKLYEFVHNLII